MIYIIFILLLGVSIYTLLIQGRYSSLLKKYRELEKKFESYKGSAERQFRKDKSLIQKLSPYQKIIDVEAEVARIQRKAKEIKLSTEEECQAKIREAEILASETEREAREKLKDTYESIESLESSIEEYKATEKAIQNIINGYGYDYLSPTLSEIETLIEEYEFKEAGRELKNAKLNLNELIKNGNAADCDYVEEYRRETAIKFVLDAFNGKIEGVFSKVKPNNYDRLEEEIIDSFNLINYNGKAFRNARITEPFLSATLEQLKWAVVVQRIKQDDREEQKRIKEQIREEERAKREYEKARKEAEKEEKMLQKAMKQVEQKLALAADEERTKYEEEIEALRANLEEALQRSERAMSMAQQTRRGHVYIISNVGSFGEDVIKVGLTRRLEPLDRVKELGDASVPFEFDVHAMIFSEDAPTLEKKLHEILDSHRVNKVNPRKEFFRVPIENIKSLVEESGHSVHWTLRAEAAEYRETLKIEKLVNSSSNLSWHSG